jgi:nucleoside-diphosphate-sugar epimerase
MDHVLVTGAGGIIGGYPVGRLRNLGVGHIRAVDCKSKDERYQVFDDVDNVHANLELLDASRDVTNGVDTVFSLAAEIRGDGQQTRGFTHDDCLDGTLRLTASDVREPLDIGSDQLVTIKQPVDIVEGIAGGEARPPLPQRRPPGRARGRNSVSTLVHQLLGRAPSGTREDGLAATYAWVQDQVAARVAR